MNGPNKTRMRFRSDIAAFVSGNPYHPWANTRPQEKPVGNPMTELFGFTLMPGQESQITIVTKLPKADGSFAFDKNVLILQSEAPVKLSISTGPLSEVSIGKSGTLEKL